MDHLHERVRSASFEESSPLRRALRAHLNKLADALRAVEWNDSHDGDSTEEAKLRAILPASDVLAAAIEAADLAREQLAAELRHARGVKPGGVTVTVTQDVKGAEPRGGILAPRRPPPPDQAMRELETLVKSARHRNAPAADPAPPPVYIPPENLQRPPF